MGSSVLTCIPSSGICEYNKLSFQWLSPDLLTLTYLSNGGSDGKESAYNAGDQGSIPGSGKSSGERNGNPFCLEYSASSILPGESHEQRSLVGYSPWGHKQLDVTERLTHNTHTLKHLPGSKLVTITLIHKSFKEILQTFLTEMHNKKDILHSGMSVPQEFCETTHILSM